MRFPKKIILASLVASLCLSFVGCTYKEKEVYFELPSGGNTVFKIGNMKCSKDEALVYLVNAKNIYGTVEGVNLWENDFDTATMCDSLKDDVMEHITKVYVLDLYATEQEMELSERELAECEAAAEEYYNSLTSEEISFLGTSEKNILNMYKNYALAEKVYAELMNTVDEEVSEDEARVMEAFVLFVSTEEEANDIQGMIEYGYTFERLASTYTELDTYQVTFARKDYPEEVDEVVFNLDTKEVSPAIKADNGYYFFQCLDKYNEELSEQNKHVIIEARRQQVLDDIVYELQDRYFSNMNVALWDSITIPEDKASELNTSTFFSTLASHVKY